MCSELIFLSRDSFDVYSPIECLKLLHTSFDTTFIKCKLIVKDIF